MTDRASKIQARRAQVEAALATAQAQIAQEGAAAQQAAAVATADPDAAGAGAAAGAAAGTTESPPKRRKGTERLGRDFQRYMKYVPAASAATQDKWVDCEKDDKGAIPTSLFHRARRLRPDLFRKEATAAADGTGFRAASKSTGTAAAQAGAYEARSHQDLSYDIASFENWVRTVYKAEDFTEHEEFFDVLVSWASNDPQEFKAYFKSIPVDVATAYFNYIYEENEVSYEEVVMDGHGNEAKDASGGTVKRTVKVVGRGLNYIAVKKFNIVCGHLCAQPDQENPCLDATLSAQLALDRTHATAL